MPGGDEEFGVVASILGRTGCFLYRCRNDRDYSMTYMRGAVEEVTGYPAASFLEIPQKSYTGIIHPDDIEQVFALIDVAINNHENWLVEYRVLGPGGLCRWVQEAGGGVYDAQGVLLHLEGIVFDHSLRKAEELSQQALQEDLATKCQQMLQDTAPVMEVLRLLRILAVNARIEAARVGDAGAGFAIVASEIGRLADDTSQRASRIASVTQDLNLLLQSKQGI